MVIFEEPEEANRAIEGANEAIIGAIGSKQSHRRSKTELSEAYQWYQEQWNPKKDYWKSYRRRKSQKRWKNIYMCNIHYRRQKTCI